MANFENVQCFPDSMANFEVRAQNYTFVSLHTSYIILFLQHVVDKQHLFLQKKIVSEFAVYAPIQR
jgi:hypothetical protein